MKKIRLLLMLFLILCGVFSSAYASEILSNDIANAEFDRQPSGITASVRYKKKISGKAIFAYVGELGNLESIEIQDISTTGGNKYVYPSTMTGEM